MTVINLMLGRYRGGLEQCAIDYAEALQQAGIPALSILAHGGWAAGEFDKLGLPWIPLRQRSGLDIFAARRLRRRINHADGQAVICHGNRALSLALLSRTPAKVIAVAHNYRTRRFGGADASFAVTLDARERLIGDGMSPSKVHHVPNMVRVSEEPPKRPDRRQPPVIGAMGRFMPKKGFEVFLDALAILKRQGIEFQASLGGDGPEGNNLRQRLALRDLTPNITLPGWVEDKQAWFNSLDMFILPSHHEPFGIVLIEAMGAGVPVVSTNSIGPREIIHDGEDGLLFPVADAEALAERIKTLLADPQAAFLMGMRGQARVAEQFSPSAMTRRLQSALDAILTGN